MGEHAARQGKKKLRILLAEDHEMVREGLKSIINAQPEMEVVGEASDGGRAITRARELSPDIIIMDISMPRVNGLEAMAKLKQECPQVKVLTLTRHTDVGFLQQLLGAGASGYVLKQSPSSELIQAIRSVASGGNYLDPAITNKVINGYVSRQATLNAELRGNLSEREEEVLRLIAWGYSNKEIAARLDISVKTVEAHKSNSMRKLDLRSRIDVVRYALLRDWLKES
ncbi:MAG TPA: response regulator transcription factor [Blastocatellia bacterium]|nr:response regulator transcription factor [Blastocatellia bacterium]